MKKSLLALAVAALAATSFASTASATTIYDKDGTSLAVYGRVQAVYYSDEASGVVGDRGENPDKEGSINASGRLGFDLRSQINPYVAGFAKAEFEMANGNNEPDENDHFDARYLWVGFDFGQYGQVKVGKFEEAIKYAISQTDIFDDWGCTGLSGNDDRREAKVAMLDAFPSLKSMYSPDDDNTQVLYFKDATATIYSFSHDPVVIEF